MPKNSNNRKTTQNTESNEDGNKTTTGRGYYSNKGYSKTDIILARARRRTQKAANKRLLEARRLQIDKVALGMVNNEKNLPIDWTMSSGRLANFMRLVGKRAKEIIAQKNAITTLSCTFSNRQHMYMAMSGCTTIVLHEKPPVKETTDSDEIDAMINTLLDWKLQ
tara:strand:+ start:254 stop:748 length:495 start_codon:yes stop_codon:yes gene_type:complete